MPKPPQKSTLARALPAGMPTTPRSMLGFSFMPALRPAAKDAHGGRAVVELAVAAAKRVHVGRQRGDLVLVVEVGIELHRGLHLRRVHVARELLAVLADQLAAGRRHPVLKAGGPGGRQLHAPLHGLAGVIGLGQLLRRVQELLPGPAILRIRDACFVKQLLVVVDGQRREILGQQVLRVVPAARFEHARQIDAGVQRDSRRWR